MPYASSRMLLASIALIVAWRNPVNDTLTRLLLLAGLIGIWLGILELLWKRRAMRWLWFGIPLGLAVLIAMPGRTSTQELRDAYITRLGSFANTPYYWGGESPRGIDCSGLPRRALRKAMLSQGLKHFDGALLREDCIQWWLDASAKDLGTGKRNLTKSLGIKNTISETDTEALQPGDLAVTLGGVHMVVYLGNNHWIQAEPSQNRVVIEHGKNDSNPWFNNPVTLHRWRVLDL